MKLNVPFYMDIVILAECVEINAGVVVFFYFRCMHVHMPIANHQSSKLLIASAAGATRGSRGGNLEEDGRTQTEPRDNLS
jgi:hypothetical protein